MLTRLPRLADSCHHLTQLLRRVLPFLLWIVAFGFGQQLCVDPDRAVHLGGVREVLWKDRAPSVHGGRLAPPGSRPWRAVPASPFVLAEHFGNIRRGYGFNISFAADLPVEDLGDIDVITDQD